MARTKRRIQRVVVSGGIESLGVVCTWTSGDPKETGASFGLEEFAVLMSGARISLHNDRGWSVGILHREGSAPVRYWENEKLDGVISAIHSVLLPEDDGDDHDWARLVDLLADKGMTVSADELRVLPYVVEVSPNLHDVLTPEEVSRLPLRVDWSTFEED